MTKKLTKEEEEMLRRAGVIALNSEVSAKHAMFVTSMIEPLLHGIGSDSQGAVIAALAAKFLCGFQVDNDHLDDAEAEKEISKVRDAMLELLVETTKRMLVVELAQMRERRRAQKIAEENHVVKSGVSI
jgi:hypothetical protein